MQGFVAWMERVFFWLQYGVAIPVAVWILVVLPMLLFRKPRPWAAAFLMYSSIFTGFVCWWYSFIVSYRVLGGFWLGVGLLVGGIGIVPIAIIGTAIAGLWLLFWNVVLAIVLTFAPRVLASVIAYRYAKHEEAERQEAGEEDYLPVGD